MTLTMRLEEPGVISVSYQVFTTQTIDAKVTLLLYYCSIEVKPFRFLHLLFHTPCSTNPWFDLKNTKPIRVMTISPMF